MAAAGQFLLENLQVALFLSEPRSYDIEQLATKVFGGAPASVEKRPGDGQSTASLADPEWQQVINWNPTRLDILVTPVGKPPTGELSSPGSDDFDEAFARALGMGMRAVESVGPLIRIGVIAATGQAFKDTADAQSKMLSQIPYRVDLPETLEDLAFQFNKKSRTRDGVNALNNLFAWQIVQQQGITFSPSGFQIVQSMVLRGMIDVNIPVVGAMDVAQAKAMLQEISERVRKEIEVRK